MKITIKNKNVHTLIMAGGIGKRFWPVSTSRMPKQFHDVLGAGETLLQQTAKRFSNISPAENLWVITLKSYADICLEQLPNLSYNRLILEPAMMNTAACIAYSMFKLYKKNPDTLAIISPSDHFIESQNNFEKTLLRAIDFASKNDALMTIGIPPHSPNTGYGYIQHYKKVNEYIYQVKTFTEKPSLEIAKSFLQSGDFFWNAGIFIWQASVFIKALKKHLPEMYDSFTQLYDVLETKEETDQIKKIYPTLERISIDIGLMEKAQNVFVISGNFGWSDLGTWASVYTHMKKDKNENAHLSKPILMYESSGNLVYKTEEKAVVIQGLKDFIVVDTPQALLICQKEKEQSVKQFVDDLKLKKGDRYL